MKFITDTIARWRSLPEGLMLQPYKYLHRTQYQLSTVNCQLSQVNYRGGGRVYKIADLKHGWLVKPAPTSQLSTIDCQLSTINCQLSTINYS